MQIVPLLATMLCLDLPATRGDTVRLPQYLEREVVKERHVLLVYCFPNEIAHERTTKGIAFSQVTKKLLNFGPVTGALSDVFPDRKLRERWPQAQDCTPVLVKLSWHSLVHSIASRHVLVRVEICPVAT